MLDRSDYNNETLDVCEIIGTYFADTYYNVLYTSAKKVAMKKSSSITEEYRLSLVTFIEAVNNDQRYYLSVVHSLLNWYRVNTQFIAINIEDFVNKVVREFVPGTFFESMSKKDKDSILGDIITHSASEVASMISKPDNIVRVIDGRRDRDNVSYLQSKMLELVLERRDIIYGKFIDRNKNKKVDLVYVNKLKDVLKLQLAEKLKLKKELNRAREIAEKLQHNSQQQVNSVQSELNVVTKQLAARDTKIVSLKSQLTILTKEKEQLETELEDLRNKLEKESTVVINTPEEDSSFGTSSDDSSDEERRQDEEFERRFNDRLNQKNDSNGDSNGDSLIDMNVEPNVDMNHHSNDNSNDNSNDTPVFDDSQYPSNDEVAIDESPFDNNPFAELNLTNGLGSAPGLGLDMINLADNI